MDHEKDTPVGLMKSIGSFFSGTLASRITGLGRDVAMAAAFGCGPSVAALMMAFRFSHLLRRLLGEGALQAAFIPYFERLRSTNPEDAFQFFRDLRASLALLLIVLIAVGELFIGASLWSDPSESNREVLFLTALMLPSLFFICMFGIDVALLQCERHFFLPGAAPVAFNLVWIAGVIIFSGYAEDAAMVGVAVAIVLACLAQWMMVSRPVSSILAAEGALQDKPRLFPPHVWKLAAPLILGTIGVGASQINNALDYVFARYADAGGPAYLWYAIRLEQLPVGLFGVALSGALMPTLSRVIQSKDMARYQEILNFSLQRAIGLMVPVTCAAVVMGLASVDMVYARGDFNAEAIAGTVWSLWGYAAGIFPAVAIMVLAPALYAQGDYRSPTIASALSVAVNIALSAYFVFVLEWGASSVALATSLAAIFNCACLVKLLKRNSHLSFWPLLPSFFKVALASCLASYAVILSYDVLGDASWKLATSGELVWNHPSLTEQAGRLVAEGALFLMVLVIAASAFKVEEITGFLKVFNTKKAPFAP